MSLGNSYVGSHVNLDRPDTDNQTPITSNILLARVLEQKHQGNELKDLDEGSVVDYLKGNLKWTVTHVSSLWLFLSWLWTGEGGEREDG